MIAIQKLLRGLDTSAPVAFFHYYFKPPYGGSNQFMLALEQGFIDNNIAVSRNKITASTKSCLLNAHVFDYDRLHTFKKKFPGIRIIHRIDGPMQLYRGYDDGSDKRIASINAELAHATVFQSLYSLHAHQKLGICFNNACVIQNAVNPSIFYPKGKKDILDGKRKIRLLAVSWSDNPHKGGPFYSQLEKNLDWTRYEFTFIGRTKENFKHINHLPPVNSQKLADVIKAHDIYVTASENDPCSNSLLEALSCGLPAVYLDSGGHKELVQKAGIGFTDPVGALGALEEIVRNYHQYREAIKVPSLKEVTQKYIAVMLPSKDSTL
ncbi:MAG TPA: glycosyltransferase family 4 protein [Candidatus Omnitrophota bacterium]|nr:glycosyltransferase family 4 protein [Candidatus Omnitrophota bacterium]